MKNIFFLAAFLVTGIAHSQHTEWNQLKSTINVSFVSSNTRFAQEQLPQVSRQKEWNIVAGSR